MYRRLGLGLGAAVLLAGRLWGQLAEPSASYKQCAVCEEALAGPFYVMNTPFFAEPQPVCATCSKIQRHCFVCSLPVKAGGRALDDGRLLCRRHAQNAVFGASEAEALFREVKRDIMRLFGGMGRMPDQTVRIHLIDRVELRRLVRGKSGINAEAAVGVTETTPASSPRPSPSSKAGHRRNRSGCPGTAGSTLPSPPAPGCRPGRRTNCNWYATPFDMLRRVSGYHGPGPVLHLLGPRGCDTLKEGLDHRKDKLG